jgi:hypothetical protein
MSESALPGAAEVGKAHSNSNAPADEPGQAIQRSLDGAPQHRRVALHNGEALTVEEAYSITRASRTRVLVVAGPAESGKTTLIASIFNRLECAPFAGYMFAGSKTLIGFEQRCHLARLTTGRATAATPRTRRGAERCLLHLSVWKSDSTQSAIDLLLADLSGEDYERASNSPEECAKLPLIRRADHFILLIDGAKVVRSNARQGEKRQAVMLLQSCLDAGQLKRNSLVDVLISKMDIVEGDAHKAEHLDFIADLKRSLLQRFQNRLESFRFFEVAARRERGDYEIAYGLSTPFASWIEELPPAESANGALVDSGIPFTEFDCYLQRRFASL